MSGMSTKALRLGTRRSRLAMAQSGQVADAVSQVTGRPVELVEITTCGGECRSGIPLRRARMQHARRSTENRADDGVDDPFAGHIERADTPGRRALVFSGATRNSLVVLPLALALPAGYELAAAVVVTQTLVEVVGMVVYVRVIPNLIPSR